MKSLIVRSTTALLFVSLLAPARPAFAEEKAATAPVVTPPDIVRTKSGKLLRGTIVEADPKGDLSIQLATGEVRRMPMSEVQYAGPAASAPAGAPPAAEGAAPQAAVPAKPTSVPIHVRSEQAHVGLQILTGISEITGTVWTTGYRGAGGWGITSATGKQYATVCVAPCEATLPPGEHRMALSMDGGSAVDVNDAVEIRGPSTLSVSYASNRERRLWGWGVILASIGAGTAMSIVGASKTAPVATLPGATTSAPDWGLVAVGSGIAVVGSIVGIIIASAPDVATVDVTPDGAAPPPGSAPAAARPKGEPEGVRRVGWAVGSVSIVPGATGLAGTF